MALSLTSMIWQEIKHTAVATSATIAGDTSFFPLYTLNASGDCLYTESEPAMKELPMMSMIRLCR